MKKEAVLLCMLCSSAPAAERTLTKTARGHLLHNTGIFSPDGRHIVFDSRNDETQLALSRSLGVVDVMTGEERTIYQTGARGTQAAGAGAASFSPVSGEIVFLKGLEDVSEKSPYAPQRRSGMLLDPREPGATPRHLDARDVTLPLTPGALRGGTHAHHWSGDGRWVSFTYNDALVPAPGPAPADLRTVGVTVLHKPVEVAGSPTPQDFSGAGFTVIIAPVTAEPVPGSTSISRAYDEGWVGTMGYVKPDGSRQRRAIAFFGDLRTASGSPISEVFIADLPEELSRATTGCPVEGTGETLPCPPAGVIIRRLTHTENTSQPGFQGPRHWVRSSPDGSTVAFLDKDDQGIVQIFGISSNGGEPRQISRLPESVETPFSWSPDGRHLACSSGGRVAMVNAGGGDPVYLTEKHPAGRTPLHGVIFSPDGKQVAFNRLLPHEDGGDYLQICLADVPP